MSPKQAQTANDPHDMWLRNLRFILEWPFARRQQRLMSGVRPTKSEFINAFDSDLKRRIAEDVWNVFQHESSLPNSRFVPSLNDNIAHVYGIFGTDLDNIAKRLLRQQGIETIDIDWKQPEPVILLKDLICFVDQYIKDHGGSHECNQSDQRRGY